MTNSPSGTTPHWVRLAGLALGFTFACAPLGAGARAPLSIATTAVPGIQLTPALELGPEGGRDVGAAPLRLAQATSEPEGKTLQFGAPPAPPPPPQEGTTLQFGAPPAPAAAEEQGQTLQLGTPPVQGQGLQIGAPPPAQGQGLQIGAPPPAPGQGLQVGGAPAPTMPPAEAEGPVRFSFPWLRAEGAATTQNGSRANTFGYLSGALRAEISPAGFDAWSVQGTVRVDSYPQSGDFDDGTTRLDYGESFVRYDGERTRITVGALKVLWGRVDEIPPTDQMSVQDLTRFTLDNLEDRRRAVPALRVEHSFDELKLDTVLMPWFRPAELPDSESLWYPVRQEDGRIISIGNQLPLFNEAIRTGTIGSTDDFEDFGGAGVRLSRRGAGFDGALTAQRTRRSLPYYELDPAVRAAVLQGLPLAAAIDSGSGPTFREVHPLTWVVGGDLALEALGGTVRLEAAWLSDVPVTTFDARLETHDGLDWVGGYEFFPGDGNTRVTLQLAGHHIFGAPSNTLDRMNIYTFLGELEIPFAQERWRFNTRFSMGLNDRDIYLNPKLSYLGWEPHDIFIAAHLFSGSQRTFGGFYEDNDSIVLGWRAQY